MQIHYFIILILCFLFANNIEANNAPTAPTANAPAAAPNSKAPIISSAPPFSKSPNAPSSSNGAGNTPAPTKAHPDTVGGVAFFFCVIPIIWFCILLYNNYHRQEAATLRLNVSLVDTFDYLHS